MVGGPGLKPLTMVGGAYCQNLSGSEYEEPYKKQGLYRGPGDRGRDWVIYCLFYPAAVDGLGGSMTPEKYALMQTLADRDWALQMMFGAAAVLVVAWILLEFIPLSKKENKWLKRLYLVGGGLLYGAIYITLLQAV